MPDDIVQQVIAVIARKKKLDPAQVTADSTFEQLGLDSLDAADLLFTFEDTFGIVVPDEVALSMKSVGQVAVEVRKLLDEHGKSTEGVTL
jgi:acyl carrier protein